MEPEESPLTQRLCPLAGRGELGFGMVLKWKRSLAAGGRLRFPGTSIRGNRNMSRSQRNHPWDLSITWRIAFSVVCGFFPITALAGEFLVISDLHFDPYAGLSPQQFQQLSDLPAKDWPDFFRALKHPVSGVGADSNYALIVSALDAAQKRIPDSPFILFPGDLMTHDWQRKYNELAERSIEKDPVAFREFTQKAIRVLATEFHKRFPAAPVFVTLGNDDSFCQDYWIQPGGEFLEKFCEIWRPMLDDTIDVEQFSDSFKALGVYTAELPGLHSERLIAINSVFWSGSYATNYFKPDAVNCCDCENPGPTPGRAQIKWLELQLLRARKENQRVWLLMHIPPGLDSYAEEKVNGQSQTAEMWADEFSLAYRKLIADYQDVVRISFNGHVHMDDFRMDRIDDEHVVLHKIVPAVSPVFGNNPAFQVFQLDDSSCEITNWQTQFLDLSDSTRNQVLSSWKLEYDARTAYGIDVVTAATIRRLIAGMVDDPEGSHAQAYRNYYRVSASPIAEKDLRIYLYAVLYDTFEAYRQALTVAGVSNTRQDPEPARLRRTAGGIE